MARLAALGRVHSDGGRRRPVASAGNSIPVSAPNPKSRSIAYCSSGVSRAANLAMAMLLETRIASRSEEHTSELQSPCNLVCRLLLEKKKKNIERKTHVGQKTQQTRRVSVVHL